MTCIQKGTTSGQIGVDGGSLALPSFGLSLAIPPGAITASSLGVRLSLFVSEETVDIEGRSAYVGLIELLPHKTNFAKPVILRYELKHHHRLDVDQRIEAHYGLFYGEGTDPSERYDFIGRLELTRRLVSHKGIFHLRDDCLELSTLSFCRHCCIVQLNGFGITISFFVRPKGIFDDEREWAIRIIISCSCRENLENIQKEQKTIEYVFVDKSPLRCQMPSFISSQRLEFSLGNEDYLKSNFSLHLKKRCGRELFHVVQGDTFQYPLTEDCTIKCSDDDLSCCTDPLLFSCKYTAFSEQKTRTQLRRDSQIGVRLNGESSCDYRLAAVLCSDSFLLMTVSNCRDSTIFSLPQKSYGKTSPINLIESIKNAFSLK